MWLFLSDAMLSIVQKPGDKDVLTVRARIQGDIERVFPDATVEANKGTDYKYRAKVPREQVAKALFDRAMDLSYANFKSTVKNRKRHDAYLDTWEAMYRIQDK